MTKKFYLWRIYINFALDFRKGTTDLMQRSGLQEEEYQALLDKIVPIMLENGLKATTMDLVAARLGMSKRTLYEIFESKSEMIKEALRALEKQNQVFFAKVFSEAENVMEGLIEVFKYNRDLLSRVNVQFYRDMDRLYKDKREEYEKTRESRHEKMLELFMLGVEQGMFRSDVDYNVQSRMMGLQMESMKRMEELFPPDITLQRVFDAIIVSFLRSIASTEGMRILDSQFPYTSQQQ